MANLVTFFRGSTVNVHVTYRSFTGALVDPDNVSVTITDAGGTIKVNSSVMTNTSTGIYDYYYYIPSTGILGVWRAATEAIEGSGDSAKRTVDKIKFKVEA